MVKFPPNQNLYINVYFSKWIFSLLFIQFFYPQFSCLSLPDMNGRQNIKISLYHDTATNAKIRTRLG